MDVAATLEVRGFAAARRGRRAQVGARGAPLAAALHAPATSPSLRRPRSRASLALSRSPLVCVRRWRSLSTPIRKSSCASARARSCSARALLAAALLPFCDRRGIEP